MVFLDSYRVFVVAAFCLSTSVPALCAPASQAEAERLTAVLQSYTFGFPEVVTVKPSGDSYDVTVDLKSMLAKIPQPGVDEKLDISVSPLRMKLTDQGGGKWLVEQTEGFDFAFKSGSSMQMTAKVGGVDYSGVFDEKLGLMESMQGKFGDISFAQSAVQDDTKVEVVYSMASIDYSAKNELAADGTVNGQSKTTYIGFKESIKIPPTEASTTPLDIVINIADGQQDTSFKGIKTKELVALIRWAFANIPSDGKSLDKAQLDTLKPLMLASLPVFNEFKSDANYNTVSVVTNYGTFDLGKLGISMDLNGALEVGRFRQAMTLEKLTLPQGIVPPWGEDLMANKLVVDFQVTEFNALAAAQLLINRIDTLGQTGETPEFEAELVKALLPTGAATFTLNEYSMVGKTYDMKLDGSVIAGPDTKPTAKGTMRAKSLSELVAAISAIPAELNMSGAVIGLTALSAMAKKETDGTLLWDIEASADGKVLINGVDYGALANLGGAAGGEPAVDEQPADEATDEAAPETLEKSE